MTATDDILAQIPISSLAAQLGVDEATAEQAARQALPALSAGWAPTPRILAGPRRSPEPFAKHDPGLVEGGVNLDDVDVVDGDKIVGNVFGDQRDAVVSRLSGAGPGGVSGGLVAKLLPLLAPIVMSYLAKQFSGSGGGAAGRPQGSVSAPDVGDLLGGLLGGGSPGGGRRTRPGRGEHGSLARRLGCRARPGGRWTVSRSGAEPAQPCSRQPSRRVREHPGQGYPQGAMDIERSVGAGG